MDQALSVLDAVLTSVLSVNDEIIANMIDAAQGRVTPSLFPLPDLIKIIRIGQRNYSFQSLYPSDMSQYYFPLLEAILTTDIIVVHVPFRSTEVFNEFEIVPFPFSVEDAVLTLDMSSSLVLIVKDYTFYSTSSYSDLIHCKSSLAHKYHSSASLLAFVPISGGVCVISLRRQNASCALSTSSYKHLTPTPVFYKNFHGLHYFSFSKPFYIAVSCPEGTIFQQFTGHYATADACHVRSANITTYLSRIHVAYITNVTHRVFPLKSLLNLHFSMINYVNNTLNTLTFANESDLADALEETLPEYLSPHILYPSVMVPIVKIIIW